MKKTILVVDDSPFASKQIETIVEGKGYKILGHAKTGEEGITMYHDLHPDLVILDIIMPGIDGLETAELILKENKKAKILMLSSLCDSSTLEEVKSLGLEYLLSKPIEPDVLIKTLEVLTR